MESLPEELVINIFSYLNPTDLISLSLTCKRFSKIISNSHELNDILTVRFSSETKNFEWIGSRKCTNVSIINDGFRKFMEINEIIGNSIKKLSIFTENLLFLDFVKIMKFCPNLKKLKVTVGNFYGWEVSCQLPNINLEKLSLKGSLNCLKILKNSCQTRELHICLKSLSSPVSTKISGFLKNQRNLEILKLENFTEPTEFPQNYVDFQLKKFSIKNCSKNFTKSIQNFLNLHVNSLEEIQFYGYEYHESNMLVPFKNLKTVEIVENLRDVNIPLDRCDLFLILLSAPEEYPETFYHKFTPLPQVKNLKISEFKGNFKNYSECFPNIEKLVVRGSSVFIDTRGFDELKIIEIYAKNLTKSFKTPRKLTTLKLIVDSFPENEQPFTDYNENNIEELTIGGACDLNWIKIFIKTGSKNLKIFRVFGKEIDPELRKMLEKLENVEVIKYCKD